jgi:hypothetical protein
VRPFRMLSDVAASLHFRAFHRTIGSHFFATGLSHGAHEGITGLSQLGHSSHSERDSVPPDPGAAGPRWLKRARTNTYQGERRIA